jgi:hypothetical protein
MHRNLSLRIAVLILVAFTSVGPAFAAGPRDDSPIGGIERAITRVVKQIKKIFNPTPTDLPVVQFPQP